MTDKKDLYQQITDRFIKAIEKGTLPWQCPWDKSNSHSSLFPINFQEKTYQGVNTMLLWIEQQENNYSSNKWMTLKQANAQGASIKKGEQGTAICFFKPLAIKDEKSLDKNGKPTEKTIPLLRSYTVFNTDQINNLPIKTPELIIPKDEFTPIDKAERVLKDSNVKINEGGSRAIYNPSNDEIFMPDRFRFGNSQEASESYYATALHELAHATKHPSRTGRLPYETDIKNGSYAFEELVAEVSASFTLAELQLQGEKQNHESYVANWLEVLNNDKKAIFKAASQARKATEWIKEQSSVFTKEKNQIVNPTIKFPVYPANFSIDEKFIYYCSDGNVAKVQEYLSKPDFILNKAYPDKDGTITLGEKAILSASLGQDVGFKQGDNKEVVKILASLNGQQKISDYYCNKAFENLNPSVAANDKEFNPTFDQTKINQQEQIQKILSTFEQPTTEIFSSQSAANEPVYSAGKGRGR